MHFADDEVRSDLHHINFRKIGPHSWKKLRAVWKNFNAKYKAALRRFTMSGMYLSNFYEFWYGCHDIYYLRKHLEAELNLVSTVVVILPEEVFMESIETPSSTSRTSTKCKHENGSKIVDVIHDMQSIGRQSELSKCKLDIMQQIKL